jgi:hypothetical protein
MAFYGWIYGALLHTCTCCISAVATTLDMHLLEVRLSVGVFFVYDAYSGYVFHCMVVMVTEQGRR